MKEKYKGQLTQNHSSVKALAKAMGYADGGSIMMRKRNFDYLDPSMAGGLSNFAGQTKRIWNEYQSNPDVILAEASKAFADLVKQ